MRRWVLICLGVPALAAAKSPAWYADGAASVEVPADGVELPILRGEATDWNLAVLGAFPTGDEEPTEELIRLTFNDQNRIPESVLADLGLKAGGDGSAVVPEIRLGDVVLRDVRFLAEDADAVLLNTTTLPEAAFAVLPSTGVVKVVPASQGDALLGSVGEPVQGRVHTDKWWYHGQKIDPTPTRLEVPGAWMSQEGYWSLTPGERGQSSIGGEAALPEGAVVRGGIGYAMGTPEVAGVALPKAWFTHDQRIVGPEGDKLGTLSYDTLYATDIAFDPATLRIALAQASDVQAGDPAQWALEQARAAYAEEDEEPEADEEEGEESSGDPAVVAKETAFADALMAAHLTDEALEHYKAAAAAAGDDCKPYLAYGEALLTADRAADAAAPLERAATLWDRWDSQPLETRQKVEKGRKAGDDVFTEAQDPSCHTAWGQLAAARLVQGDHDGVAELYEAHFALDPHLALVHGVSLLSRGEARAANGVLRQALDAGARDDVWTRLALGLANVHNGRGAVVRAQVDLLGSLPERPGLVAHFIAFGMVDQAEGPEAAYDTASALASADPLSLPARAAYLLAAHQLDRFDGAELEEFDLLIARAEDQRPGDRSLAAYRALSLALAGDTAGAEDALGSGPTGDVDHAFAGAMVANLAGDEDTATARLEGLARVYPHVPLPLNWPQPGVTEVP